MSAPTGASSLSVSTSLTVFAGTAQLASLPILAAGAPLWVLWATAFCVNLRFVIFSAQWRIYLEHLPRGRRVVLGYFLADLNLLADRLSDPLRADRAARAGREPQRP